MNFNDNDNNFDNDDQALAVGGDFNADGSNVFGESAPVKKYKTGPLVLIIVIVAAAAGLFSMNWLAKATAAQIDKGVVENTIDAFLSGWGESAANPAVTQQGGDDGARIIGALDKDYTEQQVPLSDVQKNPFIIFRDPSKQQDTEVVTSKTNKQTGPTPEQLLTQRQDTRRKEVTKAAEKLELKSVIMGARPLANLSGRIVRQGEVIEVTESVSLRVEKIEASSVTLVADDSNTELGIVTRTTLMIDRN